MLLFSQVMADRRYFSRNKFRKEWADAPADDSKKEEDWGEAGEDVDLVPEQDPQHYTVVSQIIYTP